MPFWMWTIPRFVLPLPASGRRRYPGKAAGACEGAPPVRLSLAGYLAGTRRDRDEPQEAVSAVPVVSREVSQPGHLQNDRNLRFFDGCPASCPIVPIELGKGCPTCPVSLERDSGTARILGRSGVFWCPTENRLESFG